MAQSKRKRRRKHRGTQAGSVDRRRRKPRNRQEARAQARRNAELRRDRPPTWQSAINRALIGGLIFFALITLAFGQTVGQALTLTGFMVLIYVPMGYYMEKFFYSRRKAAEAKRRAQAQQQQPKQKRRC